SDVRGVWINVGMGIKDDLGEAGYSLWLEWSQTCPDKFDASDTRHKWNSYKGAGITIATVFGRARDHGWREQRKYYDGDRAKPAVALRARPDMGIVQRKSSGGAAVSPRCIRQGCRRLGTGGSRRQGGATRLLGAGSSCGS